MKNVMNKQDYIVKKKENWHAQLICGSDDCLRSCECIEGIEDAEWIWGYFYTRNLFRKEFHLASGVQRAIAHFKSDNVFDFYMNQTEVAVNVKEFSKDVTEFLKTGQNFIAVRVFQTDDVERFTSSFCGKLVIETTYGTEQVITDESWKCFQPADFSVNYEPENWMTADGLRECQFFASKLHHRQQKHSLYVRKKFELAKEIQSAKLSVFSKGEAEMYLNGKKVGNEFFSQGIHKQYFEYHVFDVKDMLIKGHNVLGAITGNTWLNSQSHSGTFNYKNGLLAELEVTYADGEKFVLGTDGSFKTHLSPIVDNHLQFGERYDARMEISRWCDSDFDDTDWYFATVLEEDDVKPYVERCYPPIIIREELSPQASWDDSGIFYYDFGCNAAGTFTLKLKNTTLGQKIKITVAEQLDENGDFVVKSYAPVFYPEDYGAEGRAKAAMKNYNHYICRGGQEVYMPRFTFNGFRYLKLEGVKDVQIEDIKMNVLYNDISFGWDISCSDSFYKDLAVITERAMKSNLYNGFMDCPTREKNFWTGDIGMFSATACYLADCHQILSRWTDGGRKMCDKVYGWGDEVYTIPLELYQFYGDRNILELRYKDILDYARERIKTVKDILPQDANSPFNDHLNPFRKNLEGDYFAGCFYCYMMKCIAQIARILGDKDIAKEFDDRFNETRDEFNRLYYRLEEHDYQPHSQSGIVLPLAFGITPKEECKAVAEKLNSYIVEQGCLTTGFVCTRFLMQVLCDYGYLDTAFMLLSNEQFPSWRNILVTGATSMTEHWTGMDLVDKGGSSKNHFCLGSVVGWFFEYLGGIRYKESEPGFALVHLQPTFIKQIGDFSIQYTSGKGIIKTAWHYEGKTVTYEFEVPVTARLKLPDGSTTIYPPGKHKAYYTEM